MSNGYPVRGLLIAFSQGSMSLAEIEENLNHYIEDSCRKGYSAAIIDAQEKALSGALGGATRRNLSPIGISGQRDKSKGSEGV